MKHVIVTALVPIATAMFLSAGCSQQTGAQSGSGGAAATGGAGNGGTRGGSGGTSATSSGGTSGSGGDARSGGATGSGGTAVATGGSGRGGASATGGAGGGGTGSGGSATGGTLGRGGSTGTGGTSSGGAPGTGGASTGGTVGRGGATGTGGASTGGTTGTAGTRAGGTTGGGGTSSAGGTGGTGGSSAASGDDFVSDVKVAVDANTKTILVVTWTQLKAADNTLLEFSFSGSSAMTSRALAGATGAHRDVVLGVPEKTAVTLHIVSKLGGVDYKTKDYTGTTGAIPSGMPRPTFGSYDASLASPERWLLGAVEDSTGGCPELSCYYDGGLFWIFIMDRQGRIVWYWADPASNASSSYPRVARDGEYIVFDKAHAGATHNGATGVMKMTLDRQYYQSVAIDGIDDAIDITSDGSILYDNLGELHEYTKQGTNRMVWSCKKQWPDHTGFLDCYSNTVNWVPADDTVVLSFPYVDTVAQIDRKTGTLVGQYGNSSGSYAFSPSSWKLQFQHSATITPEGTLLVSSHLPDYPDGTAPGPQHHAFEEFTIDRANKKLTQKWIYSEGKEWAAFKGYNLRLANGNTLVNYGSGGVIREVTPDKKTAFEVSFLVTPGDGYDNKMVGNTVLVADLYALNGSGPK
jgi:hypothetical protein